LWKVAKESPYLFRKKPGGKKMSLGYTLAKGFFQGGYPDFARLSGWRRPGQGAEKNRY